MHATVSLLSSVVERTANLVKIAKHQQAATPSVTKQDDTQQSTIKRLCKDLRPTPRFFGRGCEEASRSPVPRLAFRLDGSGSLTSQ